MHPAGGQKHSPIAVAWSKGNVLANVLRGAIAQFAILSIIVVGLKGYYYSRLFLGTYFGLLYSAAIIYRLIFVQFLRHQMAKGRWQRKFILVGMHSTAQALIELVNIRPDLGLQYQGTLEVTALDKEDFPESQSYYVLWHRAPKLMS